MSRHEIADQDALDLLVQITWISRFKYGDINDRAYQKEIIDIFVNAVCVYDDKTVFTYNFKDGCQTMTLQEIEAALGSDLELLAPPDKRGR